MPRNVIEATYRITTPMFCSGADQAKAELRLASFKGALRFWWRTLMWRHTQDVAELHKQEAALFGASDQDYGQSKVRLRMGKEELEAPENVGDLLANGHLDGAHYLGYGVVKPFGAQRGRLTRPMIPGGTFTVRCRLDGSLTDAQRKQVSDALILLGTVGGMGSKSRKGFGSLTLTTLTQDSSAINLVKEPVARLKQVLGPIASLPPKLPEWTAWSAQSSIVKVTDTNSGPWQLLDLLGREQVHFRSWGSDRQTRGTHLVLGEPSEKNFKDDHDLFKWSQRDPGYPTKPPIDHPVRIAFGLPHNYGQPPSTHVEPAPGQLDRRASPLFLHIHQMREEDDPVGLAIFLPARFLPAGAGEQIRAFGTNVTLSTAADFWDPVKNYLARLTGAGATARQTAITGREEHLA